MSNQPVVAFEPEDVQKNKTITLIACIFPILFFLPLVSAKDSNYGRFFANQSLLVVLLAVVVGVLNVLSNIPVVGLVVAILALVVSIFELVCWILNLVHVCKGEGATLPLIGGITLIK